MEQFDFEQTDVYQLTRELNREIAGIIAELPQRARESADNLQRAGKSITRNLAEGWGKWHLGDKLYHFQVARGSSTEVPASLNELVDFGYTTRTRTERAHSLARKITASIVGLIRYWEKQPPRPKHDEPKRKLKDRAPDPSASASASASDQGTSA